MPDIYYPLPTDQPAPNRTDHNEETLINTVWTEVDDRLRQSLHNALLIRLDMAEQRTQVSRSWDSDLRTADQKPKPLAPGTPVAEVFDRRDVGGKLLVLGNPGAGKTTTMLDLAATLVQRANSDPDEPIPVIVNLSSWQIAKGSFDYWLINELKLRYGLSSELGQTWLSEKKLLPLLDGLDELPSASQEPAVQDINAWLQSDVGASRLLVCSRLEEYELYASKLDLNGAICLSPLTDGQLQSYLASLKMAQLWKTLQHHDDLLAVVRTPLLLSVSILVNNNLEVAQWSRLQTTQERFDYLLDAYIVQQLHKSVKNREYPPGKQPTARQTRRWLVWLAKRLQAQSKDEFLIEKMQPTMLTNPGQNVLYALIVGLISGLKNGLIVGMIVGLMYGVTDGLIVGLIVGLSVWLNVSIRVMNESVTLAENNEPITLVEDFEFSPSRFTKKSSLQKLGHSIIIGPIAGLESGLYVGLSAGLIYGMIFGLVNGLIFGLIVGLIVGLIYGLIVGLVQGLKAGISIRVKPNQGILAAFENTLILLAISISLLMLLSISLPYLLRNILEPEQISHVFATTSSILIWASIADSSPAWIQHFSLRLVLHRTNAIPWNYARFLNLCNNRLLLQRVGGRYRFIHRLVQERFAAMPLEEERGVVEKAGDGWLRR